MIQSVLMLFAPAQESPLPGSTQARAPILARPGNQMATRPQASGRRKWWWQQASCVLAVVASSLGFMLFLAGLGLVLRVAEVLLS
jgi:hypothetical protein